MAAQILTTGHQSRSTRVRQEAGLPCEPTDEELLSSAGSAAAFAVAVAAMLLAAAPALVAVVAIVSPGELDRAFGWLLGGSAAFFLVAAGRVPAAALLALALAGRRAGS